MCGIGGCVLPVGEAPERARLEAMRAALAHRGPDGSGVEVLGNVALVHTRLSIVDTSEHACQPMRHPDGQFWISYNGEIFNHEALRREMANERFGSPGDTSSLLHAVARWDRAVLPRLNGQFALAVVDLDRRRLLLARDRFGIKPLYVARARGGIWFASEPEALFAAGVGAQLDDGACASVVDASCYGGATTVFAQVQRVLPGTCQEISLDDLSVRVHRWSSVAAHVGNGAADRLASPSRRRASLVVERALRSAVHDALLGDVPIGVLCSGGVDSSLVAALAVEVKPDMVAFGARYREARGLDEGGAEQKVAQWLGIDLDLLEVTRPAWRSGLVEAAMHFGAPLPNASSVTIAQMAERARRRGIKVLLTGEGADELFAGYTLFWDRPWREFMTLPQQGSRLLEWLLLAPPSYTAQSAVRIARRYAARSSDERARVLEVLGRGAGDPRPADGGRDPAIEDAYRHHSGARRVCETDLLRDFDRLLCFLLNRMDKNMMQVSVEARVPFLDPRVVEAALNLPLEARVTPWSKGVLRDVARRHLPWDIAHRRKIYGMMFDAATWIEEAADPAFLTAGMFQDVFSVSSRELAAMLEVARGIERFRLWSSEIWCRAVLGGQSKEAIEKELWPQGP